MRWAYGKRNSESFNLDGQSGDRYAGNQCVPRRRWHASDILLRHRATPAQVGLTGSERSRNVAGAFTCTPQFATGLLAGRTIGIIDDVTTTGATLAACAAPLFAAGARTVWGLVLARPQSKESHISG